MPCCTDVSEYWVVVLTPLSTVPLLGTVPLVTSAGSLTSWTSDGAVVVVCVDDAGSWADDPVDVGVGCPLSPAWGER